MRSAHPTPLGPYCLRSHQRGWECLIPKPKRGGAGGLNNKHFKYLAKNFSVPQSRFFFHGHVQTFFKY